MLTGKVSICVKYKEEMTDKKLNMKKTDWHSSYTRESLAHFELKDQVVKEGTIIDIDN